MNQPLFRVSLSNEWSKQDAFYSALRQGHGQQAEHHFEWSEYKNPVNDVGVTRLYGIDNIQTILDGLRIRLTAEHSFTPPELVNQLKPFDRMIFKLLFTGRI